MKGGEKPAFDEGKVSVEKLKPIHRVESFECEDPDIQAFLIEDAMKYQDQGIALTKLLFYDERLVGYYSLANDSIKLRGSEWKKLPDLPDGLHPPPEWPALKFARMGTQREYQSRGFGSLMVNLARGLAVDISKDAGCRFLTVDAYPKKETWYGNRGFVRNLRKIAEVAGAPMRICEECGQAVQEEVPGEHADPDDEPNVSMRLNIFNPLPPAPKQPVQERL